jgi:virulence-associated protein VagC
MSKVYKTKLFQNGGSQAVRIPAELRLSGPEVEIRLAEDGVSLIISDAKKSNFKRFRELQLQNRDQITERDREILGQRTQVPFENPAFLRKEQDNEDA